MKLPSNDTVQIVQHVVAILDVDVAMLALDNKISKAKATAKLAETIHAALVEYAVAIVQEPVRHHA